MKHIKLTLQYDGTDYSGWQVQSQGSGVEGRESEVKTQKNIITIQGILQEKIRKITGEDTKVVGAGRTDAGVHAFVQVAAFKTQSNLEPQVFLRAINANIPHDIRVINAEGCSEDFHPRYSAKNKTYSYRISHKGAYAVFLRRYSWQIPYQLNCDLMKEAAECLIGTHDFSCFRASGCSSKNPVRTIFKIEIVEDSFVDFMNFKFNVPLIKISIQADAFLRHMVRNIVGTLVEVGRGRLSVSRIKEILELKDRRFSGPTAPAQGLFLEEINY